MQATQDTDSFPELGGVAGWWSGDDVWLGRLCQGVISRIQITEGRSITKYPLLVQKRIYVEDMSVMVLKFLLSMFGWFRMQIYHQWQERVGQGWCFHIESIKKPGFCKQSSWRFTSPPPTGPTRSGPPTAVPSSWGSWSGQISPLAALRRRWFVAAMSRCVSWRRDPPQIFSCFGRYFLDVHSGHGVRKWWL